MSKTIEIIIRAKDQATKTLNAFGKEVNTGKIALKAFNETAAKGKQASSLLAREIKNLAIAAVGIKSFSEFAGILKNADKATFSLQQSVAAANREFKNTGDLDTWNGAVGRLSGELKVYSETSIKDAISRTIDMTKRLGLSAKEMEVVIQRTGDLSVGKVDLTGGVERVTAALRGEAEASEYLGLTLNENYVKAWHKAHDAHGKAWKDLTDLEKAQVRYQVFLEQTAATQGKAAKSTETFSGALAEMGARINDTITNNREVNTALKEFSGILKKNGGAISTLVADLVTVVGHLISWTLENKKLIATFIGGAGLMMIVGKVIGLVKGMSAAFAVLKATQIGTWLTSVAGAGNLAAGGLNLVAIAMKGALIVAAINAVIQVGKLVKAFFDLRSESEKLADTKKLQAGLDENVAKQLEKINQQTGLNIKSVKEYIALQKAGVIVRNQESDALEANKGALGKYREATSKTGEAQVATLQAQNDYNEALDALRIGLPKTVAGVDSYALKMADLKIALAQDKISQDEYNQQTLAATKKHWSAMVETRQAAVDKMKNAGKSGTDEYAKAVLFLREAELELIETETETKKAIDSTGTAFDKNKQRLKDALDGWQAVADEGVANYVLALTDLDIALAKGRITEAQYHEKSLKAEKEHWVKMVATRAAALATMAAAGLKGTSEYTDALQQLKDAELELITVENQLQQEIPATSKAMNVSESAWAAFAKKVGLTVDELKNVVEPAAKAAEAGRKAATVSEAAWEAFARKVGMTTAELKSAVAGVMKDIEEANDSLKAWREQTQRKTFSASVEAQVEKFADAGEEVLLAEIKHQQETLYSLSQWVSPEQKVKAREILNALEELLREKQRTGFNTGGAVPGSGSSDTVPAMLTPGEFVIRKSVVNTLGTNFFRALNNGLSLNRLNLPSLSVPEIKVPNVQHFATGGMVQEIGGGETITVNLDFGGKTRAGLYARDEGLALVNDLHAASLTCS